MKSSLDEQKRTECKNLWSKFCIDLRNVERIFCHVLHTDNQEECHVVKNRSHELVSKEFKICLEDYVLKLDNINKCISLMENPNDNTLGYQFEGYFNIVWKDLKKAHDYFLERHFLLLTEMGYRDAMYSFLHHFTEIRNIFEKYGDAFQECIFER